MKTPRSDFKLEFKKEAVRLVRDGQRQSQVSASLGISGQRLHNWVKAEAAGRLTERVDVKAISAEPDGDQPTEGRTGSHADGALTFKKAAAYFARESR